MSTIRENDRNQPVGRALSSARITLIALLAGTVAVVTGWTVPAAAGTPTPEQLRAAAKQAGSVNGLCPVMKQLVSPKGGSVTYDGEHIAFCCPGCAAKFQREPARFMDAMRLDPAKYGYVSKKPRLEAMQSAKRALGSANGRCPVMGGLVKESGGFATYKGQKIAFCCPMCSKPFAKDPEKYMRRMRADPLAYAYDRPGPTGTQIRAARDAAKSVNGVCPVLGKLVTGSGGSVTYKGQKIAFCCPSCLKKFQADPEKYMQPMRAEPAVYGYLAPAK